MFRGSVFVKAGLVLVALGANVLTYNNEVFPVRALQRPTLGVVSIAGVAHNDTSITVYFPPVAGAKDYRIFDTLNPNRVKYAGQVFNQDPANPDIAIQWNGLNDGSTHTFVVQATDALGPSLYANQYDVFNKPLSSPLPPGAMLGADSGFLPDGTVAINGQGPSNNTPQVIAQSAPFSAAADLAAAPLPSMVGASQVFYDPFSPFEASTLAPVGAVDPLAMTKAYTLGVPPEVWDIRYQNVDTTNSMPFIADGHFMDMIFDGGTFGTGNPQHTQYGVMAMTPRASFDFSGGRVLHATMQVDDHTDSRRWVSMFIVPANDPIQKFHYQGPSTIKLNNTDTGVMVQGTTTGCLVDHFTGVQPSGQIALDAEQGAAGQATNYCGFLVGRDESLDNRVRLDIFLSQTQYAFYRQGKLWATGKWTTPLTFTNVSVVFAHYLYHSSLEEQELQMYNPSQLFWINTVPYSDERHWADMGAEVLPAWADFAAQAQPPVAAPLVTGSPSPSPSPLATVTATSSPKATVAASPTSTPVPVGVPAGTYQLKTTLTDKVGNVFVLSVATVVVR